jgi:signal transduction histidine kinase
LEAERQRADYLEGVTSVSTALRAAANRDQMMAIIADQLERLLKTPHLGIVLRIPNEEVVMQVGRGLAKPLEGVRGPADQGILGEILRTGRPFTTAQASTDPRVLKREIFRGNEYVVGVALAAQDQTIGGIIAARPEPFVEEEVRLLTAVAEMAGNALNRAGVMETLEERVTERTADLEAANLQLLELDQLKSAFVSNVSHELRTPITNILLYLDLLSEPARQDRAPTYMGILRGEAERLHRLIEDLLTLSRLERGTVALDLEPQVLDALIAEVTASQEARAHLKQIDLRHEPNPKMPLATVAHGPMVQVLTNLIGNAVSYSPAGAVVTVNTRVDEARGSRYAAIRVHNSQPAIPEEDLPRLFERFFRGQTARTSGEAGTGLGLAICKEIVELHHGWIDLESAPATGTAFTIWLPLDGWS